MNTAKTAQITAPAKTAPAYSESQAEAAACKQIEADQKAAGYVPAPVNTDNESF